jgi:hypothetical protein
LSGARASSKPGLLDQLGDLVHDRLWCRIHLLDQCGEMLAVYGRDIQLLFLARKSASFIVAAAIAVAAPISDAAHERCGEFVPGAHDVMPSPIPIRCGVAAQLYGP